MLSADGAFIVCDNKPCENQIKNHAWVKIKSEGWVMLKNDQTFCPDHKPAWYDKWKKNR